MVLHDKFPAGMKVFQIPLRWFRKVTAWINNVCGGPGIIVTNPTSPSDSAPVSIAIDEDWLDEKIRSGGGGGGGAYTAGDGIDAAALAQGQIAVDPDKVVTVLEAEDPDVTIDGNTASGTDETLDDTTWEAGGTSALVIAEFTRSKAVTVNNVYYYRLFWRLCTYNPNGTRAAVSAEQGYVQVRRL